MARAGPVETFSQESDACVLFTHLGNKYPGGACYPVYESGFCGFPVHYSLVELGIKNIIVNAAGVPATQKEALVKTDKIDAAKLARALEAGLLAPAFVPERGALANRGLVRARSTVVDGINPASNICFTATALNIPEGTAIGRRLSPPGLKKKPRNAREEEKQFFRSSLPCTASLGKNSWRQPVKSGKRAARNMPRE
ncbi:hypothetical protein FACS189435_2100 [Bacteroidia bacterium]|nr:hypothetical protein FACS189435_2100 [Bacteroidia bacterium]